MLAENGETDELQQLRESGEQALAKLFSRHREKLRLMVRFRLDKRLFGRVDTGDVIQEAYLKAADQLDVYLNQPTVQTFVWLRRLTGEVLVDIHRHHLGAKMRDASREVEMHGAGYLNATSFSLASHLVGSMTSPSRAAMREEMLAEVREALDSMDEIDREVLALRHFEELSNNEVADILGLQKAAASNRYMRALKRLRSTLSRMSNWEFHEQ